MAYDPVKAHEYYVNYRKKGLKKGRKKGKGTAKAKKGKTYGFLGVSSSGFSDEGRIQAALVKERLKREMNAALAGAKTDEERDKIRAEYSQKAMAELNALKANPKYAKATKAKATKEKTAKASSGKSSGGGSGKAEKAEKASGGKSGGGSSGKASKNQLTKARISQLTQAAGRLSQLISSGSMTPATRKIITDVVNRLLTQLKALRHG